MFLVGRGESSNRILPSTYSTEVYRKGPLNLHKGLYGTGETNIVGLPGQPKNEEISEPEKFLGSSSTVFHQPDRMLREVTLYSVHCPTLHKTERKNQKCLCWALPLFINIQSLLTSWASLVVQQVKNLPAMRETWVQSLGWEDPLEKGKATHSVFWPGEFHGLYSPWGHKELDTTEELSLHFDLWTRETVAH